MACSLELMPVPPLLGAGITLLGAGAGALLLGAGAAAAAGEDGWYRATTEPAPRAPAAIATAT
jgi:hypothetical protein